MSVKELSDALALHTIKRHDWHVQARTLHHPPQREGLKQLRGGNTMDGQQVISSEVPHSLPLKQRSTTVASQIWGAAAAALWMSVGAGPTCWALGSALVRRGVNTGGQELFRRASTSKMEWRVRCPQPKRRCLCWGSAGHLRQNRRRAAGGHGVDLAAGAGSCCGGGAWSGAVACQLGQAWRHTGQRMKSEGALQSPVEEGAQGSVSLFVS